MRYEFECPDHGRFDELRSPKTDDLSTATCQVDGCGKPARRIYGAGYAGHVFDFWYGFDPSSGRHFDSKAAMERDAAQKGQTLHRT